MSWPMEAFTFPLGPSRWHGEQEIVSKTPEGPTIITNYAEIHRRAQLCALALTSLGIG